jgi:hypothetical protein
MRREIAPEREGSREEMALRATLQAHASETIDIDVAWEAVASRLAEAHGAAPPRRWRAGSLAHVGRGVLVAAALVALVVALAGAGVGVAYWGGLFGGPKAKLIGDESLYTTIDRRQTVGDVTVRIDKAYADPDDTYVAFSFTMPYDMASRYTRVIANHMEITDAAGNEGRSSSYSCEPLAHDPIFHRDGVEHCLIDLGPFHPAAGVSSLSLKVEIGELWLFRVSDGEREFLAGPWRFDFSLPFHQQSLGPGGPYADPTRTP